MTETLELPAELHADAAPVHSLSKQIPSAHVEIYDQIYHLRGVDPIYIAQLAATVDQKMRAVSQHGGTVDSLRVAVLAALNIADELTSLRKSYNELTGRQQSSESALRHRAESLSGMLDEVLSDRRVG